MLQELTIIHHYAKLLKKEVDVGILLELTTLRHQHEDTPTTIHVVTQHMKLEVKIT